MRYSIANIPPNLEKISIWRWILFFGAVFGASIIFVVCMVYVDMKRIWYMEASGVVTSINWQTRNHHLPLITVLEDTGKVIFISHSVALTKNDIKVNDVIVKEKESEYCLINGEKVLFIKKLF